MAKDSVGYAIYDLLAALYPLQRNFTGSGLSQSLDHLAKITHLSKVSVPSGSRVFDWTVPMEWRVKEAYIEDARGRRVVDRQWHPLHLVANSSPVNLTIALEDLLPHLYSVAESPDAIPYVAPFLNTDWGFCLTHRHLQKLKPGYYRVVIDGQWSHGVLQYGECEIRGRTPEEILLWSDIGYGSLAEAISGAAVLPFVARWIRSKPRRHSYRLVYTPGIPGLLAFLAKRLPFLKKNMPAGFAVNNVGGPGDFTLTPTQSGDTLADRAAGAVFTAQSSEYHFQDMLDRNSAERQFIMPGIDLPIMGISRGRYGDAKQHMSSQDDLFFVSPKQLQQAYNRIIEIVDLLENNIKIKTTTLGEPHWGRMPDTQERELVCRILACANGHRDTIALCDRLGVAPWELYPVLFGLRQRGLVQAVHQDRKSVAALEAGVKEKVVSEGD